MELALLGLPLLLAVAVAPAPAAAYVGPSLACTCASTHFDDIAFTVRCARNVSRGATLATPGVYQEDSSVRCERGPHPGPRADYERVANVGYFKFHKRQDTWEGALRTCAREGARLAIVNSNAEADALGRIFKRFPKLHDEAWLNDQAWVGLTDLKEEGKFVTLDGTPLTGAGWEKWAKGEPNNEGGDEHCLAFDRNRQLNDEPCSIKLAFFCERRL